MKHYYNGESSGINTFIFFLSSRLGQKMISKLGRVLAFIMGYHNIKFKGKLASSEEAPVIVIAPHSSFMDAALSVSIGHLTYMSRKENDQAPLFGRKFEFHSYLWIQMLFILFSIHWSQNFKAIFSQQYHWMMGLFWFLKEFRIPHPV